MSGSQASMAPNNISGNQMADLNMSWHIPRPTLARSSTSSQGSTSSNNSTQSTKSGTLLLTAANLAQIQAEQESLGQKESNLQIYLEQNGGGFIPKSDKQEMDNVSIASSMHFTVVNVNHRPQKIKSRSFCSKHQLTILVISMSILFMIGIIAAIFCIEMRARRQSLL